MTSPFDQNNPEEQRESTANTSRQLKDVATEASATIKQQATKVVDENRGTAADEIENVAQAARTAAEELQNQDQSGLSHYVTQVADSISSIANGLREKNIDDLIRGAEKIARENPALFIAGSVAIGLGIARLAKASSHRTQDQTVPDTEFSNNYHTPLATDDYAEEDWLGRSTLRNNEQSDTFSSDNAFDENVFSTRRDNEDELGAGALNRTGDLNRPKGTGPNTTGGTRYE